MILDIGLPLSDGFTVLRRLRAARTEIPVIILTARDSVSDTVARPGGRRRRLHRQALRLRGTAGPGPAAPAQRARPEATVLRVGDLALDLRTPPRHAGERSIDLSDREFALAEAFFRHPEQVLSREQLLSQVWGFDFDPGSNVVDVYVRYLRRKIGSDRIETVRGTGYRLKA